MIFHYLKIKNNVFNKKFDSPAVFTELNETINKLRESKDIIEKRFGDISSFNFTRKVFNSGKWSALSKVARGLFINTNTQEIIARGYEKFFNYNEGNFNQPDWLNENLKFPVISYKKYNGYLGLLGYDKSKPVGERLIFCSKSTINSEYANWFKTIFNSTYKFSIKELEEYLEKENLCFIFEIIDPINDPHIIKYEQPEIILLSAIKRSINFDEIAYEQLVDIANKFNWKVKEQYKIFNDWNELASFIKNVESDFDSEIEGYVLEDSNKYMFKLKGKYYKVWKNLRSIKELIGRGRKLKTGFTQLPVEKYFIDWCEKQEKNYLINSSIIDLREEFFKKSLINSYKI